MPKLEWNKEIWDSAYDWSKAGAEWSTAWGSPEAQWYGTLLPRIHRWLPAQGTILEIAPGFGRWTEFLRRHCTRLVGVDLAEKCVRACQARFAEDVRCSFSQNDGQSLAVIADGSIDFCFSYDSLVHAPIEAVSAYVSQLAAKLTPQGITFLHHSNFAQYLDHHELEGHCRDHSSSGELVADTVRNSGLAIICQEYLPWGGGDQYIDCITTFTRKGSKYDTGPVIERSTTFAQEALTSSTINRLYGKRSDIEVPSAD